MYRVKELVRESRASVSRVRALHTGWRVCTASPTSGGDGGGPGGVTISTARGVPKMPRRKTISELATAQPRPLSATAIRAATDAGHRAQPQSTGATSDLPTHLWRRLPAGRKWSHLGRGVFHLVSATDGGDAKFDLMRGVGSNLFTREATIHRILAYESDLIEESARDSTATAEVAIVGRSNVGKSSLINALLVNGGVRKQLATTSRTPGRTQMLFMFSFKDNRNARIVDCPGYGYARASMKSSTAWNKLMGLYLRKRARQGILKRVLVLVDSRRGIGPLDEVFMKFLESESIAYQIVMTKADALSPAQFQTQLEDVRAHLRSMPHGRYNSAEEQSAYDARTSSIPDDDADDDQWQTDVNTGEYSTSSLFADGGDLPSYSCSLPIIHAISSRHDLGISTLQQSLTKMLTMERHGKMRVYQRDGEETADDLADDTADDDGFIEDDGMDNQIDEEDAFTPPLPVQHYDAPRGDERERKPVFTSRRSKFGARSGSKFGARSGGGSGRRGFATSARHAAANATDADITPAKPAKRARSITPSKPRKSKSTVEVDEDDSSPSKPKSARAKSRHSQEESTDQRPRAKSDAAVDVAANNAGVAGADFDAASAKYQKKTQRQHILDRPETYIGSVHHQHSAQWVYADPSEEVTAGTSPAIVQRECYFVPSLVHIFDEILVNAADNQHRTSDDADGGPPQVMTTIRVDIDDNSGRISVFNDGASIPVLVHATEGIPIPELIFGHLLTSSNYNDTEQRFTGGRHGFGAKLTNIFSREFTVEIQDVARRRRYRQTFTDNMANAGEPIIESFDALASSVSPKSLASNYTRITFLPDFHRFRESGLTRDTVAIMKKRVFDVAACVNTNIAIAKANDKAKTKSRTTTENDHDEAATSTTPKRIKVYLNDALIDVDSFPKYLKLFPTAKVDTNDEDEQGEWVFNHLSSHWQVAVGLNVANGVLLPSLSMPESGSIDTPVASLAPATRDISFVNSIYTSRGGTHVAHVSDRIARAVADHILRTDRSLDRDAVPLAVVKSHMSLLVNCKVPNPSFSSQTKESLMTPPRDFSSECPITPAFLARITADATGIVPAIRRFISRRQEEKSRANTSKRSKSLHLKKLLDAHWAGGARAQETCLFLTEGDSAKALVVNSISVARHNEYGVFPLKGKPLNALDASMGAVTRNEEIQNLLAIIGLEIGRSYYPPGHVAKQSDRPPASKPLRYGRVILMTDQDHDGSHIKGLLLVLFYRFWPELLEQGYLYEFVTAIIKVTDSHEKTVLRFQTQVEYDDWRKQLPARWRDDREHFQKRFTVKYYKGLGTNTNAEGKEYFQHVDKHLVQFTWSSGQYPVQRAMPLIEADSTSSTTSLLPTKAAHPDAWIRLAFAKDQSHARKEWLLRCYIRSLFVDTSSGSLPIGHFINRELIAFSHADNIRSIPHVLDGLKPVQRKVLFGTIKKNAKDELKVAQLGGYISGETHYHHGEVSMHNAIINMAQNFVGSNNLELMMPNGQFGSRSAGGKDSAAARYLYTDLAPIARHLFHPHDDTLLTYTEEDGESVEPEFYLPVIPTVLVNGAEGIGTGFSTFVPTFNPKEIIANLRAHLRGEAMSTMHPWVRGWHGVMRPIETGTRGVVTKYSTDGLVRSVGETEFLVEELPIGRWPEDFKEMLAGMQSDGLIRRFYDECSGERVQFRVHLTSAQAQRVHSIGAMRFFKLSSALSLTNMHLFDSDGHMRRYRSPTDILTEFVAVRIEFYRRRREQRIIVEEAKLHRAQNKLRYLAATAFDARDRLALAGLSKAAAVKLLQQHGFESVQSLVPVFPAYEDHRPPSAKQLAARATRSADVSSAAVESNAFDYLLGTSDLSRTSEMVAKLQHQHDATAARLAALQQADATSLWVQDLAVLEAELDQPTPKQAKSKSSKKRGTTVELQEEDEEE